MNKSSYQVTEVKLSYKNKPDLCKRPQIAQSKDAYRVLINAWDQNKIGFIEEAKMLLLNRSNTVLGICELGSGGVSGVIVNPKLVIVAALKANASSILLAHNHPSQNLKPSGADRSLTDKITQGGKLLEITVLDHLILSPSGYYSLSDGTQYDL